MADRIRLNRMEFYGFHGVLPEERALGQRYLVDVELRVDVREAARDDDLAKTVNYAEVYHVVEEVVTGPSCQLIETVAERVAASILGRFAAVQGVEVRLRKPAPPIRGARLDSSEVRIRRDRE